MSIQRLKEGQVYQSRTGKRFLCIWSTVASSAKLVSLESGFSFIAQCTEIMADGKVGWIEGSLAGHKFGELRCEEEEARKFFPDGFPWEKEAAE